MAITLSSTHTITIQYVAGDPVGNSYANPYTLDSIITASDAGTRIVTSVLNAGGSGYAVNDTFTVDGVTAKAKGKVLTVDGSGAVLTYEITEGVEGDGYSVATGITTTKIIGSGTGLTIDITAVGAWRCKKVGINYYIPYPIVIKGTTTVATYFYDYGKNLEIYINPNIIAANGNAITALQGGFMRFGKKSASVSTNNAMSIAFTNNTINANMEYNINAAYPSGDITFNNVLFGGIYSFFNIITETSSSINYEDCFYNNCRIVLTGTGSLINYKNICIANATDWIWQYAGSGEIENISINSASTQLFRYVLGTSFSSTAKNVKLGTNTARQLFTFVLRSDSDWNWIDCNFLKYATLVNWYAAYANKTSSINYISTFKFSVGSECVGGTLKLYDKDNNEILNQAITTEVFEEEITYYSHVGTTDGASTITNTIVDKEPFRIEIMADDYETGIFENIYVTAGVPTGINATLKTQVPVVVTPNDMFIKKNPKNYGANRDLAI